LHLSRLHHNLLALGFAIQMNAIRDQLMAVHSDTPLRCRMTLSQEEQVALNTTLFAPGTRPLLVAIAPMLLALDDPWLRHKSTQRRL
jgi:4-amino-4-deoxychorismate lyase